MNKNLWWKGVLVKSGLRNPVTGNAEGSAPIWYHSLVGTERGINLPAGSLWKFFKTVQIEHKFTALAKLRPIYGHQYLCLMAWCGPIPPLVSENSPACRLDPEDSYAAPCYCTLHKLSLSPSPTLSALPSRWAEWAQEIHIYWEHGGIVNWIRDYELIVIRDCELKAIRDCELKAHEKQQPPRLPWV